MDLLKKKDLSPMLIARMQEPFDDENWVYELKLDGCRCLGYFDGGSVFLRNKRNMELLPRFPELKGIGSKVEGKKILDGELVVLKGGTPDFYELQRRTMMTDKFKIQMAASINPASFVAFDCLYTDGKQVMDQPLLSRKELLQKAVKEDARIAVSRFVHSDGVALFRLADERELEGVVAKRSDSLYYPGKRTKDWIKFKRMADEDFVVCGYIRKKENIYSIVLGKPGRNGFVYKGHVTLGVPAAAVGRLRRWPGQPFMVYPSGSGNESAVWVYPEKVCTVEYMPNTKNSLRQAVFKGFREDMAPEDVE